MGHHQDGRGRTRRGSRLLAITLVAALLAACGSGDDAVSPTSAMDSSGYDLDEPASGGDGAAWQTDEHGEPAEDGEVEAPTGASTDDAPDVEVEDATGDAPRPVPAQTGRRVIRTAELVLEVDDPGAAADEVVQVAERAEGFVAEADLERDAEGVVRGSITLRVPTAALLDTVDALDELASAVPVRRIDERDVTAESADLEAQRTNLTTYETELRGLLADVRETTERPDDLLTVFERIRSVRSEIDRIEAQLSVLSDQVSLSTIQVTIVPAAQALPVSDPTWQPGSTVREALSATARTLAGVADAAIWLALTALPVLAVTVLPVVLVVVGWMRWWRRREGDRLDGPPPTGGRPPSPPGGDRSAAPQPDAPPA